jgi:ankyrin repeat protein
MVGGTFMRVLFSCLGALLVSGGIEAQTLHEAVRKGDVGEVRALLTNQPHQVDDRNDQGYTPLHVAAREGSLEIGELLLSFGADPNRVDWDWKTPLHWAAISEREDFIRLLLDKKANLEAATYEGMTPLHEAVSRNKIGSARILVELGAELATEANGGISLLHSAAAAGDTSMLGWLLSQGLDINSRTAYGLTPLHFAAIHGNLDAVRLLIREGASVDARAVDGRAPIHWAEENGFQEVENVLRSRGGGGPREKPVIRGLYLGLKPPGRTPERFAPGIVSTHGFEFAITFTPDGKELYFTRREGEARLATNTIMVMRDSEEGWSEPEIASFSGRTFDFETHITPDGKRLIWGSARPMPGDSLSTGVHQWFMNRRDGQWSEPRPMPEPFWRIFVMYVSTTLDGTVYFTGMNPANTGGLFLSRLLDGRYQTPELLPKEINRFQLSAHPFVTPDESIVLFDAQPNSPISFEGALYVSFRREDGSWTQAERLPDFVNAGPEIMCASVSPDGKYLFYAMGGDIYWVDFRVVDEMNSGSTGDRARRDAPRGR